MTIKRIKILNLFNTFDHEIRFNRNITIIMGENGVGKTVTLRLIEALFSRKLEYLLEKVFSEIIVTFHKETWHISKHVDNSQKHPEQIIIIKSSRKGAEPFEVSSSMLIPRLSSMVIRVSDNLWYNRRTGQQLTRDDLIERYGSDALRVDFPEWYLHQCEQNRVNIIKTQRLFQDNAGDDNRSLLSVESYSNELSALMQEEISKAAKSTGDLDRTFPKRLLKQMRSNHTYPVANILEELHKLEKHRLELSDLGLLTETEANDASISEIDENDKTMISVLHLYVKDSWQKLHQYDVLYKKLSLLKDIINSHYKYKTFNVDSLKGFVITPNHESKVRDNNSDFEDKEIKVNMLSSGEQNELVLFYELLFKCDDKDLILIDEPEISLHLDWLQKMIYDLLRITNANGASLLIATHSPDFVGDNYDLVQNLS